MLKVFGFGIDERDEMGNTALFLLADEGNLKAVELLLELEANPTLENKSEASFTSHTFAVLHLFIP